MTEDPDSPPPDGRPDTVPAAAPEPSGPPARRLPTLVLVGVAAGVLALVSAVLPWFAPTGTEQGRAAVDVPKAFCWQAGRVGFLAPLAIIGAVLAVVGPRLGWWDRDRPIRPLRADGVALIAAGVVAAIFLGIAWYFLPASYSFSGGLTWHQLERTGITMNRGPQFGYFLAAGAAAVALVAGVLLRFAPGTGAGSGTGNAEQDVRPSS